MLARLRSKKAILIGGISLIILALVVVFAVPAFAAGPLSFHWGSGSRPNENTTTVQGTITGINPANGSTLAEIVISTNSASSTPNPVTLALSSDTNFNIHGIGWIGSGSLAGDSVTATYDKNQTVTPPIASAVIINMPTPTAGAGNSVPNRNFATVEGTLTGVSNGGMTINITGTVSFSDTATSLTAPPTVAIVYNKSTGVIQGLTLPRLDPSTTTTIAPHRPLPNIFATVHGTLGNVSNTGMTITIASGAVPGTITLTIPSTPTVAIVYNKSTGVIQELMLPRSGPIFDSPSRR